jgi:hypothetical protein
MRIDTTHLTPIVKSTTPTTPAIMTRANRKPDSNLAIALESGHKVSKEFYDLIHRHASTVIPKLRRNRAYQSKGLCGVAFWETLTADQQRMAGRCVAEMVRWGQLPLVPIEGKPNDPLWFRHK